MPFPYGGKQRQVQVDIDTQKLQAYGLSAADVVNAISAQNIILPAGAVKIRAPRLPGGEQQRAALDQRAQRPAHPHRQRRHPLYVHDVGSVRATASPAGQHRARRRSARCRWLQRAMGPATPHALALIRTSRPFLPHILKTQVQPIAPTLNINPIADQSVLRSRQPSAASSAGHLVRPPLAAAMILVFLGNWRSTSHHCRLHPRSPSSARCSCSPPSARRLTS